MLCIRGYVLWIPVFYRERTTFIKFFLLLLLLSHFSRVSVRRHRRQPTRLRCPWDSPGKNTGVGCHFLLQCMKVKSESEVTQSCPTLLDPMDCSLPGSSIHGIFQARVLEWGAVALSDLWLLRYMLFHIRQDSLKCKWQSSSLKKNISYLLYLSF